MESIENALALKQELDSLRPVSRENEQRIMQKFRLDWNYHSNSLEGNSLTYGETKALILFGITAQGKPLKDHLEIAGHNEAVEWVMDVVKGSFPLTEAFIRQLHTLLLKEPYEVKAITAEGLPTTKRVEIGQYKKLPNHVLTSTGEIFRFATPEETPSRMEELVSWYRKHESDSNVNPILLASEFHYRFIRIHPFDDGNGRTARILMNFILMKFNFPPVIIKTADKGNYLSALQLADAGLIDPFVEYIAKNLLSSFELMIRGARGLSIEEPDDLDKELELLSRRINNSDPAVTKTDEILEVLFQNSFLPLFTSFAENSKKFNRFYHDAGCSIFTDDDLFERVDDLIPALRDVSIFTIKQIELRYYFSQFKNPSYGDFTYHTHIKILLHPTVYIVSYGGKENLVRRYTEPILSGDIAEIISYIMEEHKKAIEKLVTFH
nr:Fic family protein [uncultured Dyadobacter sp.]